MGEHLVEHLLSIPVWAALLLVFALPALEASAFVGVLVPGEITVLLGGVLASEGRISVWAVGLAAALGAVAGDQVGYLIGARYGERLLRRLPHRLLDEARLRQGQAFLRRLGAKGVVVGRWTASLRALVPGLSGMAGIPYRRFAVANVVGGTLWAGVVVGLGYAAGSSWRKVQAALGKGSIALAVAVVVLLAGWLGVRHLLARRRAPARAPLERSESPDQPGAVELGHAVAGRGRRATSVE